MNHVILFNLMFMSVMLLLNHLFQPGHLGNLDTNRGKLIFQDRHLNGQF